ncbi:Signal transduction histidine kinase [Chitinophaga sp. CF118]|uniref:sensor histidine kinase n=1 Tax=Chitinophaga sp. CF118 TaxID=1884367 RepID=UPI0008EF825C|nr:HAMP domain-containing sensor histidine kinase [Chitinophaga sp. CF118]SFE67626.1 Signal transduction histidine kinase [Chitinophaga sp. CF118]
MLVATNPPSESIPQTDTETMQTFMGMLAHEMRTQIAGICTASNMLLQEKGSTKNKGFYLSYINSMSLNVLHVLNNMMASTTVVDGKLDIKPMQTSIHIRKWLKSHIHQYDLITASRSIKIKTMARRTVPEYITTDVIKLGQILKNLIDNALKSAPTGTSISIYLNALGGDRLLFMIADQGRGIPEDKTHLLFQPFQLLDQGLAGTGLGLYISKLYATSLGGDIMLGSNDERGTTFLLLIATQADA